MSGITAGSLEVCLAQTAEETREAQSLRYKVFYEEMAACPSDEMAKVKRDFDRFDECCDHLLVVDHDRPAKAFYVVPRIIRRRCCITSLGSSRAF